METKISYEKVEDKCNELHALAKKMKATLDEIERIRLKVESGKLWSGPASENYAKRLKKITSSFDEVYMEIENTILFLANCSDGYQAIDKEIMREICTNLNLTEPNLSKSKIYN